MAKAKPRVNPTTKPKAQRRESKTERIRREIAEGNGENVPGTERIGPDPKARSKKAKAEDAARLVLNRNSRLNYANDPQPTQDRKRREYHRKAIRTTIKKKAELSIKDLRALCKGVEVVSPQKAPRLDEDKLMQALMDAVNEDRIVHEDVKVFLREAGKLPESAASRKPRTPKPAANAAEEAKDGEEETSEEQPDPDPMDALYREFSVHPDERRKVEVEAMRAVEEVERERERQTTDVSNKRTLGYDILSTDPQTDREWRIEVKGRRHDANTVIITRQEVEASCDNPDEFILAIVLVENGVARTPRYVYGALDARRPPPEYSAVAFKLKHLLEKAQNPK